MPSYQQTVEHCPQCGNSTSLLHPIDSGMKLRLAKENIDVQFDSICTSCFKSLSKTVSNASYLQAEKQIQENFKKNLWKARLSLFRQARNSMSLHQHADAAANYEKYLKTLEYVYEKKRAELSPGMFKDKPREVTLVASALWALVEIYDLHPNYYGRQEEAAHKLGEFISYTNLFTSVVKMAHFKSKHAKNPRAFKIFLKSANVDSSQCFIASAAYPDRNDPTIKVLRQFRAQILKKSVPGRIFIATYYRYSPALAFRLKYSPTAKFVLRAVLPPIAACLKRLFNLQDR